VKTVKVADWGKDHWSLVGYVETLCVDSINGGVGVIDKQRVRANEKRHPFHAVNLNMGVGGWKPSYGSRLSGYWKPDGSTDLKRQIKSHDDWDCLNDLEAAGFIEVISEANGYVRMTSLGQTVAADLRRHKASGGYFSNYKVGEALGVKLPT